MLETLFVVERMYDGDTWHQPMGNWTFNDLESAIQAAKEFKSQYYKRNDCYRVVKQTREIELEL